MKMTKIAFWRKVKEVCSKSKKGDGGRCYAYVSGACTCEDSSPAKENGRCEMAQDVSISKGRKEDVIAYAEKQIKRHESKSKKKDHIADASKKVEEPKPIKTVGIDNSDVTLALTAQHEPTPLQIAKMIRDNGYKCIYKNFDDCRVCPFISAGCGSMEDDAPQESKDRRKKLIDDYISANEPCEPLASGMCSNPFDYCEEDCPANSEIPQPIKFEDEVPFNLYTVTEYGIFRFTALRFHSEKTKEKDGTTITKEKVFAFEGDRKFDGTKKEVTIDINNCYKTPEEALQVAKKLWNGDGK